MHLVAVFAAAATLAVAPTEGVPLTALGGSGVTGKATAGAQLAGTRVVFRVRGISPNAAVRAIFQAGTCAKRSASFAAVGSVHADAGGQAKWSARVLFHGTPVSWQTAADGGHVLVVIAAGKAVACGVIPGMS